MKTPDSPNTNAPLRGHPAIGEAPSQPLAQLLDPAGFDALRSDQDQSDWLALFDLHSDHPVVLARKADLLLNTNTTEEEDLAALALLEGRSEPLALAVRAKILVVLHRFDEANELTSRADGFVGPESDPLTLEAAQVLYEAEGTARFYQDRLQDAVASFSAARALALQLGMANRAELNRVRLDNILRQTGGDSGTAPARLTTGNPTQQLYTARINLIAALERGDAGAAIEHASIFSNRVSKWVRATQLYWEGEPLAAAGSAPEPPAEEDFAAFWAALVIQVAARTDSFFQGSLRHAIDTLARALGAAKAPFEIARQIRKLYPLGLILAAEQKDLGILAPEARKVPILKHHPDAWEGIWIAGDPVEVVLGKTRVRTVPPRGQGGRVERGTVGYAVGTPVVRSRSRVLESLEAHASDHPRSRS